MNVLFVLDIVYCQVNMSINLLSWKFFHQIGIEDIYFEIQWSNIKQVFTFNVFDYIHFDGELQSCPIHIKIKFVILGMACNTNIIQLKNLLRTRKYKVCVNYSNEINHVALILIFKMFPIGIDKYSFICSKCKRPSFVFPWSIYIVRQL